MQLSWSAKSQYITGFLKYWPKNMALLVQKLWRKKMSKSISDYIYADKKKVPMITKLRGGIKSLVVGPIKKEFFWRIPFPFPNPYFSYFSSPLLPI